MKIRRGNMNGSLVVGVPADVAKHMGVGVGSHVTWSLNASGRWELIQLGIGGVKNED